MQSVATVPGDAFARLATQSAGLENAAPIMAQALISAGDGLRRRTIVAETAQTGLAEGVIERAQGAIPASAGRLAFTIVARGGSVRLKYFGAKEGGGGVSARPWGRESFYAGAFITSGKEPNRRPSPKLNGQVYTNIAGGKWRGHIRQERPGLFIPTELTRGATEAAFESGAPLALQTILSSVAALLN